MNISKTLKLFLAQCGSCTHSFGLPLLSDSAYGEFVLKATEGRFAYLSLFDEPMWRNIENSLNSTPNYSQLSKGKQARVFQEVLAKCADQMNSFGSSPICPVCSSRAITYGDSTPLGDEEIPVATLAEFLSLSPERQVNYLEQFVEKSQI